VRLRGRRRSFLLNIARDGHVWERGCGTQQDDDPRWNVASKNIHTLFFLVVGDI